MPELPEVETVVQSLRPKIVGQRLSMVWWSGKGLRLGRPLDFAMLQALCTGAYVGEIHRRGKYILMSIGQGTVLVHLGMSGQLRVQSNTTERPPHTHVVWGLGPKLELRFIDPRRFGWVEAQPSGSEFEVLKKLGMDPLSELTQENLATILHASKKNIKTLLLDQSKVAGLGNIYVCEALFRAGISPHLSACRAHKKAGPLLVAIKAALQMGLAHRGTSLRDYVDADGIQGTNARALLVYGQEGRKCRMCQTPIQRSVDGGRSTFFCPRCQKIHR
jgi:formamidopyrimidine-DNA glycosylase